VNKRETVTSARHLILPASTLNHPVINAGLSTLNAAHVDPSPLFAVGPTTSIGSSRNLGKSKDNLREEIESL
jgi:hypothetical protein